MLRCEDCQALVLDHLYGLLEPAEAAKVEGHLVACPTCVAARDRMVRVQQQLARAAKAEFPQVTFTPPVPVARPSGQESIMSQPKQDPPPRTVSGRFIAWTVTATFLLCLAAIGGPALRDSIGYAVLRPQVNEKLRAVDGAAAERDRIVAEVARQRSEAINRVAAAKQAHVEIENQWITAESEAVAKAAARPFNVEVRGPGTAIPGAPNNYFIHVTDSMGRPHQAQIDAVIKDADGKELFATQFAPDKNPDGNRFQLPPGVWSKVSSGSEVFLSISAVDMKTGSRSDLTENIRLFEPTFTTFLTTDKPMYQPGETVYFRSLTLDRSRFQPPSRDLSLRYEIKAPSGQVLGGSQLAGLAKPGDYDRLGKFQPTIGPDGQPVRGVGCGAYSLSADLAGGEYTLNVYEVPTAGDLKPAKNSPIAVRKFIVNKYTPDRLEKKLEFDGKSYGPGDVVQAKFELKDQALPLGLAVIRVVVEVDGAPLKLDVAPVKTESDGTASIRFTLPKKDEIKSARLDVTATAKGIVETITRAVPLTTKKLNLEFFPEGGDLVAGVPNRVYFRATNTFGKPADVSGWLTDGEKDLVAIRTLTDAEKPGVNQGMGAFEFTPKAGQTYAVRLEKPLGIVQPTVTFSREAPMALAGAAAGSLQRGYSLPAAKAQGIALSVPKGVAAASEAMTVQLWTADVKRTVLVGAYTRGRSIAHQTATVEPGKATEVTLTPTDGKFGGVTRITVFDLPNPEAIGRADLKPLAERLVYRQPGELLKLNFAAKKSNGEVSRSFTPGSKVQLDVLAHDENGKPVPAILWATVVNQSVLTMADEKTARLLPTHFLLNGEVQKGDDLEHADFLLTDHDKAATSLDLLLGTQGWRRFAEQAPTEFRNKVPAEDADRLMVAAAMEGPIPTGWRTHVRKVFDQFWPKYEASVLELEAAEQAKFRLESSGDLEVDLARARSIHSEKLEQFGSVAHDLEAFDKTSQTRRQLLPIYLAGLLLLGALMVIVRQTAFKAGSVERRPLTIGAAGLLGLALFLGLTAAFTGQDNEKWREMAQLAPKPDRYYRYGGRIAPAAAMDSAPAMNRRMAAEQAEMAAMGQGKKWDDEALGMPQFGGGGAKAMQGLQPNMKPGDFPLPPRAPGGAPPPAMVPGGPGIAAGPIPQPAIQGGFGGRGGPAFPGGRPGRPDLAKGEIPAPGMPFGDRDFRGNRLRQDFDAKGWAKGGEAGGLFVQRNQQYGMFLQRRYGEVAKTVQKVKDEKGQIDANGLLAAFSDNVPPQVPPLVVREYAHTRVLGEANDESARTDFTETLLWQPILVTPKDGRVSVDFFLSDAISPYQVMVAGHTLDGRLGAITGTLEVRKPFSLDPKLPQEISSSDKLDVAIMGTNATDSTFKADVTIKTQGLKVAGDQTAYSNFIDAMSGNRKILRFVPEKFEGKLAVALEGKAAGGYRDTVERTMTVVQDGFPANGQKSDMLETALNAELKLPEMIVPGSLKLKATVFPNTLSEMQSGLEGLLREPYGCFEQTSTTNYPNVMILNYLNETNKASPDISSRAKQLIDRGYGRLISFECQVPSQPDRKGYEWFGGTAPPHEALTAYGLLQFTDMAKVAPVDAKMMQRTKEYLLSRRDGKGGFERNSRALDSFGYAPNEITNAYIVWALTESERGVAEKSDLSKEIAALLKLAKEGTYAKDPYFLALVANSLINRDQKAEGTAILKTLAGMQKEAGFVDGATTSITRSSGKDLQVETTAMAMLGWLKVNELGAFRLEVEKAARWMGTQRGGYGAFGGTQSTILALKALIDYARSQKRPAENGTIRVLNGQKELAKKAFTTEQTGPIVVELPDADGLFKNGQTEIRIETDAKQAYPCTVAWECRTRKPNSSADCPVELSTKLANPKVTEGETVRLGVQVKNLKAAEHGMVVAIVGIPAGLKLPEDMKQLKALTEKPQDGREKVSYWEIRGRELILYWRGMAANQVIELDVDLIADFTGEFRGPASRAYLYYGSEHKHWVDPVDVTVTAK